MQQAHISLPFHACLAFNTSILLFRLSAIARLKLSAAFKQETADKASIHEYTLKTFLYALSFSSSLFYAPVLF